MPRRILISAFAATLILLLAGRAVAADMYTGLQYNHQYNQLYGMSETALYYGEFEDEYWCVQWGHEDICSHILLYHHTAATDGALYGPSGLNQSHSHAGGTDYSAVSYSVGNPQPGQWSANADHYIVVDVYNCTVHYDPVWAVMVLDSCYYYWSEPGHYLGTTSAQVTACTGVPAAMANEYLPGVVYAGGVNPQIPCPDFKYHNPTYQYLAHFTWSELNGGFTDGNPNYGWGFLNQIAAGMVELLRVYWNSPLRMSSGYRSPAGNLAVNGSSTSHHMQGRAFDLYKSSVPAGACPNGPACWTEEEFDELKDLADNMSPYQSFGYYQYADRHFHVSW